MTSRYEFIPKVDRIIEEEAAILNLSPEVVRKLVTFIDLRKIEGQIGGLASSMFGDFLGFNRLPYTEQLSEFFARRWADHMVQITIPKEYMKYLPGDTPLFTPSRLEPVYNKVPFYEAGIDKTPPGVNTNLHDYGTVRKPPPMREEYENFIVSQFVPPTFFLEVANESIPTVLAEGLPEVDFEDPYHLHLNAEDARSGLSKHLHNLTQRVAAKQELLQFTLIELHTLQLELTADVFFTRNGLDAGSARSGGYFYTGKIPASAITVSDENIS